ncbi:MAG: tetratricopeptide repeat protein, partial [Flavobacteriales bacterium]|nr:tetratricopeptide repeat protein [Flavobacteriales bacterium]
MARLSLLLLTLILPVLLPAQRAERTAEDQLIDSLWRVVDRDPEGTLESARALFRDAEASGSYKGMLNAEQLIGEVHYMLYALDSAEVYYERALERSRKAGDSKEVAVGVMSLASIAKETGRQREALELYEQALELRQAMHDTTVVIELLLRMGNTLIDIDQDDRAMARFFDALELGKVAGDTLQMAHALNSMAIVSKKQQEFERAIAYQDSALVMYRAGSDPYYLAATLNNKGVALKDLGRYAEADSAYAEALAIFQREGYEPGIMSLQLNLGILANLEGKPRLALERCAMAHAICLRSGDKQAMSDALNEMARAHLALDDPRAALDSVEHAITLAVEAGSLEKEHQAWATRSQALEALGRPQEALAAFKRYAALNDSLYHLRKAAEIDRMVVAFETREKEAAIAHLQQEVQLDQARKRWLSIVLVAMAVAALAIVVAVVQRRRRDRQLHAAQMELQQAKNDRLNEQLDHKRRELTEKALHLAQKNELMHALEQDIEDLKLRHGHEGLNDVANKLRFDKQIDRDWEQFTRAFTEMDREFFDRLTARHPALNKNDLRLCALLTMKLGTKEVAAILNVSDEGVKKARYRLRKKL